MIQIINLEKKYGNTIVFSDINYIFEDSCIYGLVGKNGAGKTTLLNAIANYDNKYDGTIIIDGKVKKKDAFDKIERLLERSGLKMYKNYSPLELSKGTVQRFMYMLPFFMILTG